MKLLTDEPDGFSFVPGDEGGACFGMGDTVGGYRRTRRKADGTASAAARSGFPADEGVPGEPVLRRLAGRARAMWQRVAPSQPTDIRAILAAPLFDRTSSLIMAHGGATVMSAIAFRTTNARWTGWLLGVNVLLWLARVGHLRAADRSRARLGTQAVLRNLPAYQGLGLLWAAVNGIFVVLSAQSGCPPQLHALTFSFSLGICSGIAARCASTPIYAITQILMWMIPGAIQDAGLGGWNTMLSGLIVAYVVALVSVIRRLHGDLVTLISVQRRSSAMAARFDAALSNMSQGLILYDADGTLRVVNSRFYRLFGLRAGALREGDDAADVARACVASGLLPPTHGSDPARANDEAALEGGSVLELTNGRSIAVSCDDLADGSRITTYEDITERRANEARIAHMALHDALTNMPNRLLFRDRLDQSVAWLGRGEGFAIACLDLDHFKEVNDTLGHNMGDRLLQDVATRLSCCLREVDLVARLGGDEFAVLLPGINEPDEAQVVARRLIDTVSGRYEIDGASMTIGVSIGIAMAPLDGADAETLLMHADLAMYAAKADGRGGCRLFERDLSTRLAARQDLERDFRLALEREEFEMHYQPTINLDRGNIASFEALIRWNHPERGLVGPDQFIPFAEESGLIIPLGTWVLDTACRQAASWPEPVSVAVNLSPVQFRSGTLLEDVLGALERSGLPPTRLEVEITEAAILGETEATLAALRHLRALGVRVAFDDFGTGFSSLSYLHRFVFDKIKIDKSFIHDLETSESAAAIVRAITGLGQNLNLLTTAEGVETVSQLAWLRQLGCSEVQGYLFSRPQPYQEVARLLAGSATILARVEAGAEVTR